MEYSDKQINSLIVDIYEGVISVENMPEDLYFAIAEYLKKSLYEGFGGSLIDFDGKPLELLTELRENIYLFSGAKTYQTVKAMDAMITEDGEKRSFKEFKEFARNEYDLFNVTWAQTEYDTAVGQGQNAYLWNKIEEDKDVLPLLQYTAVMDANTSEICAPLDGIIKPVDDPFWDVFMPLNHYNCFVPNTPILTPKGWVNIDEINKGDLVIGGSGNKQKVIGIHINTINDEIRVINIKNNSISSTKNHRFLTIKGWVVAEKITKSDIIIQNIEVGVFNKIICAVNNFGVVFYYFIVSINRKGKTAVINTLNNNIFSWYKNINILAINKMVSDTINTFTFKKIKNSLLAFCKFFVKNCVSLWLFIVGINSLLVSTFPNIQIKHRVTNFHPIRGIRSFATKCRGWKHFDSFFEFIGSIYFPFSSINPLSFDSLTSTPCNKPVFFKQAHKSSGIDIPFGANHSKSFHLNKVDSLEGFASGQPLDRFNSLFNFICHSFFHRKFVLVNNVANIQYIGNIYNLSVENDESYITSVGVVHNCRCSVLQLSEGEISKDITAETRQVAENMDDSFKANVAKDGFVFPPDHPYFDVAPEDKKYAKDNFGFDIPEKD